jgi:hypothetical protein
MQSAQAVAVAERGDIHKSCRALEAIVHLLDDYSEAARAIVTLHKKLARALKDAVAVKPTGEIPSASSCTFRTCRKRTRKAGNALGASASVFEVLSDVDGKFSKFVDKECDAINGEVKKWFKKLAVCHNAPPLDSWGPDLYTQKEEKVHDEWIANANAKIKQAGTSTFVGIMVRLL